MKDSMKLYLQKNKAIREAEAVSRWFFGWDKLDASNGIWKR
jgi:hypothetical protein